MKPHKHAEIIKAWADGHTIQYLHDDGEHEPWWVDITGNCIPWDLRETFRIKPAEKVVRWLWVYKSNIFGGLWSLWGTHYMSEQDAKERAESGLEYKKLEWSREEFEE